MERRGEGFERERILPSEPMREVRREEPRGVSEMMLRHDLTHWSSVFVGMFGSLALFVLVGVLGVGFGLTTGTGAVIWAAVTLIVSFFCGAWFAARTCSLPGATTGLIQGLAVWAVTTSVLLLLGISGVGAAIGVFGLPTAPATPAGGMSITQGAAWGSFVALILGLIAAAIGGWVGGMATREEYVPPRQTR